MTSEELLGVLEELANNVGDCLYDWDVEEIDRLYELVSKLKETAREVGAELHAGEKEQG
jgi:hypothetical protein